MMRRVETDPNFTLIDQLRAHSESFPGDEAYRFLRDDGEMEVISFGALYCEVRRLAMQLSKHAEVGSRALLVYPSGLEFIKAFLACLYAGIIAVPSSMPRKVRSSQRLATILHDAKPSLILTAASCKQMVEACCAAGDFTEYSCLATDAIELGFGDTHFPNAEGDSIAFLQYTSGSTATPNGVEITHRNIVCNIRAIARALIFSKSSVNVGWVPLFHDMGLIANVLTPLFVGCRSVLMSPNVFLRNPFDWLHAISRFRGTCTGAPNFGWEYCIGRISESQKSMLDLSSLEIAYNGSEPVRASTLQRFHRSFSVCGFREDAFIPCYGMAESTLFVSGGPTPKPPVVLNLSKSALEGDWIRTVAPESEDARSIVSCGQVSDDLKVAIVDSETLLPCSGRRIGEIWIAGASVAKGYWMRPEETKENFQVYLANSGAGPFFRSGDLGFIQNEELFITGRAKELIIINGRNIYPQDVEQLIERSIDFVAPNMCAAFSIEGDDVESLTIVAEANRKLMREAELEQRRTEANAEGDSCKRSDYFVQLDSIARDICIVISDQFDAPVSSIVFVKTGTFPRTSSGKVQRLLCKSMALNGDLDIAYVMPGSIFDRRNSDKASCEIGLAPERPGHTAYPLEEQEGFRERLPSLTSRAPAAHRIREMRRVARCEASSENLLGIGGENPDALKQSIKEMVTECVVKWLRTEKRRTVERLDDGVPFAFFGMDSLGAIILTLEIESRIGVKIDPAVVREYQTVNMLADYIEANFLRTHREPRGEAQLYLSQ